MDKYAYWSGDRADTEDDRRGPVANVELAVAVQRGNPLCEARRVLGDQEARWVGRMRR